METASSTFAPAAADAASPIRALRQRPSVVDGKFTQPRWDANQKYAPMDVDRFGELTGETNFHSTGGGTADNARGRRTAFQEMAARGEAAEQALEDQRRYAASDNAQVTLLRGGPDILYVRRRKSLSGPF